MTKDTEKTAVQNAEVETLNTGYANTDGLVLMKHDNIRELSGIGLPA